MRWHKAPQTDRRSRDFRSREPTDAARIRISDWKCQDLKAGWAKKMQTAILAGLDEEQSRLLTNACDVAWHRVLEAGLIITPMQRTYMESVLRSHLLRQLRRGERKVTRLASRGVFLICGILASQNHAYIPGRPLQADGVQILF